MGLSIFEIIIDAQKDFYKKYKRPVTTLFINQEQYKYLTRELEKNSLSNLHGMQIAIGPVNKIRLI